MVGDRAVRSLLTFSRGACSSGKPQASAGARGMEGVPHGERALRPSNNQGWPAARRRRRSGTRAVIDRTKDGSAPAITDGLPRCSLGSLDAQHDANLVAESSLCLPQLGAVLVFSVRDPMSDANGVASRLDHGFGRQDLYFREQSV